MVNCGSQLSFPSIHSKPVTAAFDGGDITSDSGALLVARADRKIGLMEALLTGARNGSAA